MLKETEKNELNIDEDIQEPIVMPENVEVVGVRFKKSGKVYYFDPNGIKFDKECNVLVRTARGVEYGHLVMINTVVKGSSIVPPLRAVVRICDKADEDRHEANVKCEKEAFDVFAQKIDEHHLEMKPVDVEYTFDNNRLTFYFTSDGRVDFRELVKDLASIFKTRIELRQIGIRDETKLTGGLGVCGRPYCCATFLADFSQVSIKMAKEQNLSLNSSKISGACGKLMCCLKFEHESYEAEFKIAPEVGSVVLTCDGEGTIEEVNVISQTVKVKLSSDPEKAPKTYKINELNENANKKEENEMVPDFSYLSDDSKENDTQKNTEAKSNSTDRDSNSQKHNKKKHYRHYNKNHKKSNKGDKS